MQDTGLTITVKEQGIDEARAKLESLNATMTKVTVNANGSVTATGKQASALTATGNAAGHAAAGYNKASRAQSNYFAHIARTTVQSALINKLFLEFVDVSGQALKQVDLMNNFPATMASMGQSTKDSNEAFKVLTDYVGQIGGNLGDAASAVTRFTGVTNDVKSAVAIFTGLNNALIAGDSTMEEQRLAAIQFAQAFERGKPDMREWLSLTQNMSQQLGIVAKEMGYVNANALGAALRSGEESMAAFTTELTKLSTGTGPIAVQAMARMNGMQFSFNVLKNTMVQGIAAIVNAFGRSNIVSFFNTITQVIQVLTSWVITVINWLGNLANMISSLFGGGKVWSGIKGDTAQVAKNLDTGAGAADDLGKGLKKSGKEAEKINKSLAGFDKMNVLPDKTSGSGGKGGADDGGGGGAGFSDADMGALGDVFKDIVPDIKNASMWAKILAGILAALAANSLINKIFGVNLIKEFGKALWKHAILPLGTSLVGAAKTATKAVGTFAGAIGKGLFGKGAGGSGIMGQAAQYGVRIGLAIRGGVALGFGFLGGILSTAFTALATSIGALLAPIGTAIIGAISAVAAALGIPFAAAAAVVALAVAAIVAIVWLIWTNWETIWGFITSVFSAFWDWMVGLWNSLYDIFKGPVEWIWQFISSIFILIVAIVATALELIYKLVVGAIKLIYDILAAIGGWIYKNVIKPVADFFAALWKGIVDAATAAWNWVFDKVLKPIANWISVNVITPVVNFFKAMWDKISGFVSGFVQSIKNFMSPIVNWIRTNIIDRISGFFKGLWDGIKNGLRGLMDGLKNIFGGLANIFKTPMNGVIDILNSMFRKLNETVKVPDWVPGLGGKSANFPMIPRLARGGVVERATLAMIGEDGKEAVVPLENNLEWLDKLAAKINANGGNGQPVQLTVQIGEERIATKIIDLINEKTQMSGRNKILV